MILATGFIRRVQTTYFASSAGQFLASLGVLIVLGVVIAIVNRAGQPFKNRYSSRLTEALQAVIVAVFVVLGVVSFTVIWRITWAISFVLSVLSVNRWTAVRTLFVVALVVVAYLLIRFVNRSIDRLTEEHDAITDHQSEMAYHVADVSIAIGAAFVALAIWGVSFGRLFVSAGALGAIIGLAARETIGSITAGFVLLFSRPFHVGDWIEVEDHEGVVREISIVNTKIRTFDDEHVLIPNDQITSEPLINRSENDRIRIDVDVGIDYASDLEYAMAVAERTMGELDELRSVPSPRVVLRRFGDSSIVLECRFWIDEPSSRRVWKAKTAVIRSIKEAFDRQEVSIAYPHRVLAARKETGEVGPEPERGTLNPVEGE